MRAPTASIDSAGSNRNAPPGQNGIAMSVTRHATIRTIPTVVIGGRMIS
jgi:hypothetical protein